MIIPRFWTKLTSGSTSVANFLTPVTLPRVTYAVMLAGALAWCGAILLAPYLAALSSPLAEFVYRGFHSICHQLPERSFHLFGEKLAVCSRCASIYFAFLLGVTAYPVLHYFGDKRLDSLNRPFALHRPAPDRAVLFFALLPMLIDVGLDFLGIHASTFSTRTLSGVAFGIVIPLFILPAAIEGVQQIASSKSIPMTTTIKQ